MKRNVQNLFLLLTLTFFSINGKAQSNDLEKIKGRIITELLNSKTDDQKVATIISKVNNDGSFKGINYTDLTNIAGFPHAGHTSDLVYLAKAFKNKTSTYYLSSSIKQIISKGLEYWVKNDFVGDNWHDNQIATPTNLVNLMLAIGEELPKDLVEKAQPMIGRANMSASGARPSGDRIVIAGILAKNLLFIGNTKQFDSVIKIIEGEMKFSSGERGLQADNSFHHRVDRVNNTTSYGYGKFANAYGEWSFYVANTKYAFSIDKINQLVDYYLDGIYKQLVYGVYIDVSVKNRDIAIKGDFEPRGILEIERLLLRTNYRKAELEEIIKLRKGETKPTASFAKFFWQSEHFVFQRPTFYTTVRMFSTRNRNMEEAYNGPGKTTHHRADGTNYLMLKGDEYQNIWPVYDWQKISGTTIMQKPSLQGPNQIQKDGLTDFVGSVTDGLYGAVAFDFKSPHDMLAAKKAWFFFDEEYVCLGTAITSIPNLPVVTTINQVLMKSDVSYLQSGVQKILTKGNRELENVKWVYQDKIGYIFPEPTKVAITNQATTGRWSDITDQKNISKELVTEDVFMLGFNHGKRPTNDSYQYIVVPNISEQELMKTSNNNRDIDVISNTANIQAVKNNQLDIAQIAFYSAGEVAISKEIKLKMDSQGMAMITMKGDRVQKLTLSDPSRKLHRILITLSGLYKTQKNNVISYPNKNKNQTLFIVDLPQNEYVGKSVVVEL